jgi:hypothetical protein
MPPLLNGVIQSRLIDHENGVTPVHAVACPTTLCSDGPMWARLVDYEAGGAEVWATAPDCNEYPTSEAGFYGFIHPELWPPYGIPAVVGVHFDSAANCGNIWARFQAVYDDAADGWIGANGFFMQLTGLGVLTIQQAGCVDPPEVWTVNIGDAGVCIYPLVTPPHAITSIIGSDAPGENGGCCTCEDPGTEASFTVSVLGYTDGVRACRLVDYRNGVEEWASGSCCEPADGPNCCCADPTPETLIVTLTSINDCECAETGSVSGEIVYDPDFFETDGIHRWVGTVPLGDCGYTIDVVLRCVGGTPDAPTFQLDMLRPGTPGCVGDDINVPQTGTSTCDPFHLEFAWSNATCGCGVAGDFIVVIEAPPEE